MSDLLNVIGLIKEKDKFLFLYDNESVPQLYDQIEKLAADDELDLSLQDVILICRKIKEIQTVNVLDYE